MKQYWEQSVTELCENLETTKTGLSNEQAQRKKEKHGLNMLSEGKKESVLSVFLHQFCDLLVVILIVAAAISMFSGNTESTVVILAVLIMNAVLGTVQHVKAQNSLDSLKQLSSPNAKVMRDGRKIEIPSKEVMPGDLVLLEAGDLIVADGRIITNYSLQVNESSLTGESINVEKTDEVLSGQLAIGDRKNMVYSGSLVTYGRAEVLITATGMDTEIGHIASLMNDVKEGKTPLQVSMDEFSKKLAIFIIIISALVLGLCVYRDMEMIDAFMFAVALAVAAIPEALSSIVTIVQAMGTQKMAKQNAIIKDLKAVESLGCVSVICSDKTGTLTQNKMTVKSVYVDGAVIEPEKIDISNQIHRYLLYNAILNNDSAIVEGKGIGDPTEYALLEVFRNLHINGAGIGDVYKLSEEDIRQLLVRVEEIAFDSDRKLMSSKYMLHGVSTVLTKGAPDVLIGRCTHIRTADGVKELNDEEKKKILNQNDEYSKNGLRVLAFAYKETNETLTLENEKDFVFIGLTAMVDPPRPEAIKAVADAKGAGIKTVMITGDHKVTAVAIAKEIGIFEEGDMALTGLELDALTDEQLDENIERISVYARVSPENKIRIVNAWQRKGKISAMTGDGVNDAPALKKADIGVSMGITGTEVAKDASAMILADDNFATIIKAVLNGRNVYRNIKNAILFLLSGNMAAIIAVLFTSFMGLPVPFAPVHLLFINLLTDSLPAIAIGMEPTDASLLKEKPRDPSEGILNKSFFTKMLVQGFVISVAVITAFYLGLEESAQMASTLAFATLTLSRLFHGFNCRTDRSVFKVGFKSNPSSIGAFYAGVVLLAAVIFIPALHGLFEVATVSASQVGCVVGLAIVPTVLIQLYKLVKNK